MTTDALVGYDAELELEADALNRACVYGWLSFTNVALEAYDAGLELEAGVLNRACVYAC